MATQIQTLPVIFRAEKSGDFKGDVTAVFPTLPHDGQGRYFTTYAHVGQHGCGSYDWYRRARAATPAEYADLLAELQRIYGTSHGEGDGAYSLSVVQRMTPQHRDAFNTAVQRLARQARALSDRARGLSVPLGSISPLPASIMERAKRRPIFR